ncbi:MAG TPA: hypothetical protein VFH43_06335 [Candidatus Kapabacteria bacterium]|nr:hypothetical protein [Candidatus Kapabacteria bacterium]
MSCCQSIDTANSWIQWIKASPINILDLIAKAELNGIVGTYENATDFASQTWSATSAIAFDGSLLPDCQTVHTDDMQMVADAEQWNMQHVTRNVAATLPIPLRKVIFLRSGLQWEMRIPLSITGTLTKVELSLRDNAGTRGDGQASYPVITFENGGTGFTGSMYLTITLKQLGNFPMIMWGKTSAPVYSTFEMEWIAVP